MNNKLDNKLSSTKSNLIDCQIKSPAVKRRAFLKSFIGIAGWTGLMTSSAIPKILLANTKGKADQAKMNGLKTVYSLTLTEKRQKKYRDLFINNNVGDNTLFGKLGESLDVTINNKLSEPTLMHWHGLLVPNNQDGTNVTTKDIAANSSFTHKLPIKQTGTYWYHSHFGLQEQEGIFGAIVIEDNLKEKYGYTSDHVVMLSDKLYDSVDNVEKILKKGLTYSPDIRNKLANNEHIDSEENNQKRMMQNMHDSMMKSPETQKLHSEMMESGAMQEMMNSNTKSDENIHDGHNMMGHDSDIIYDDYLVNGKKEIQSFEAAPDSWQRLRIINAGASSYFRLEASKLFILIATDGLPVKPVSSKKLLITNGETYDILVKTPKSGVDKIVVNAVGQEKQTEINITSNNEQLANKAQQLKDIETSTQLEEINDVSMLIQDKIPFAINHAPEKSEITHIKLGLTGTMKPYSWSFNNITSDKADVINLKRGERVRISLINESMMPHPIHLHGHFFRIIKKDGSKGIYKHTVNVPVMQTVTIEFDAVEDAGKWLLHCHNLFHMKNGMLRVIEYV